MSALSVHGYVPAATGFVLKRLSSHYSMAGGSEDDFDHKAGCRGSLGHH
jgi:hypothetical protein